MRLTIPAALAVALSLFAAAPAPASSGGQEARNGAVVASMEFSARKYHRHRKAHRARSAVPALAMQTATIYTNDGRVVMTGVSPVFHVEQVSTVAVSGDVRVIGGRPAGCPHRYCACALSLRIFGRVIASLNLAANWPRRFAPTAPAPSMVAARSGHAFQLLSHVEGSVWRVYDANSGGGKTRIHNRSIAGYRIVDPHRPLMAMN